MHEQQWRHHQTLEQCPFRLWLPNRILHSIAVFMESIGDKAATLSAVPFWHNEPEIPKSILSEIENE